MIKYTLDFNKVTLFLSFYSFYSVVIDLKGVIDYEDFLLQLEFSGRSRTFSG